jgi:hypothetical protein
MGQEVYTRKEEEENELMLEDVWEKDFKMASRFPNQRPKITDHPPMLACNSADPSLTCNLWSDMPQTRVCPAATC